MCGFFYKMNKEFYMKEAILEAKQAAQKGSVPVGCILVSGDGKIVARAHNESLKNDNTKHAEMMIMDKFLSENSNVFNLEGYSLYITMEPCLMCFAASSLNRVSNIFYGVNNLKYGFSEYIIKERKGVLKNIQIEGGILHDEIEEMLKKFFKGLRNE